MFDGNFKHGRRDKRDRSERLISQSRQEVEQDPGRPRSDARRHSDDVPNSGKGEKVFFFSSFPISHQSLDHNCWRERKCCWRKLGVKGPTSVHESRMEKKKKFFSFHTCYPFCVCGRTIACVKHYPIKISLTYHTQYGLLSFSCRLYVFERKKKIPARP